MLLPLFGLSVCVQLSDGNQEIKTAAENALNEFLKEIREAEVVEFGPMVTILVNQCRSREKDIRATALTWITEFIGLGGTRLIGHYSGLLGSIISCISDSEAEIRAAATTANAGLMQLVRNTSEPFELLPIIQTLTMEMLSEFVMTRVACLQWLYMLHEKDSSRMNNYITDILPALLKAVSDTSDEVVLVNLQVLALIALDPVQFTRVLNAMVHLFYEDRSLLETRGALVIRKLCSHLDAASIYLALAKILSNKPDLEFISLMVQTLNLILLTAPELASLRRSLKASFQSNATEQDKSTFTSLFLCWTHNAVATFALCLLAQAYHISASLIQKFADADVTVGFLMQIDKLVQLLESPIFIQLRLHLLETDSVHREELLKSLYGLLMLLPQSQAYKTLSDRLATVSSLHMHIGLINTHRIASGKGPQSSSTSSSSSSSSSSSAYDKQTVIADSATVETLVQHFETIQGIHTDFRLGLLRGKALIPGSSADWNDAVSTTPFANQNNSNNNLAATTAQTSSSANTTASNANT